MEELFTNQNYYNNIRIFPLQQTNGNELKNLDIFQISLETKIWETVENNKIDENVFWQSTYDSQIENELYMELESWKNRIEPFHINDLWREIKKRYNPFEYVYSPTPNVNMCVSKYHPISRSFFKLWEILHDFEQDVRNESQWIVANLAEGPGGFMDCITNYRRNPADLLYGITLPPEKDEIPSWNKIENKRKRIQNKGSYIIEYGNIYYLSHIQRYRKNFANNKADYVTADGGFDYSSDFNHQEQQSYRMILSEFIISISIQKVGGNFVLKVFDILTTFTQKIIYLLTLYYDQVYIVKPYTSRSANSEKYIYCRGFRGIQERKIREWLQLITQWSYIDQMNEENLKNDNNRTNEVVNLLGITIPQTLKEQLVQYNIQYINEQKKYIQFIIHKAESGQNLSYEYNHQQIQNAIWWCHHYQLEISNYYQRYIKDPS